VDNIRSILTLRRLLLTWVGWLRVKHKGFLSVIAMLNNVMGCVVAFIPEGMPVGVALTLMMVARRMKDASVLPKGLSTVETLGCVNVICSDKTGTLTENKMTVTSIGFLDELKPADELAPQLASEKCPKPLQMLHRAAILCNDAMFDPTTIHLPVTERAIQGNATDGAVLRFAEDAQLGRAVQDTFPRPFSIPFNSKNKWMLSLHNEGGVSEKYNGQEFIVLVKGAPDVLPPKCTSWLSYHSNKVEPLDAVARTFLSQAQEKLSRNAERVIMLCQRRYTPTASLHSNAFSDEIAEHALVDLTIIGLLGILDPPRSETADTVATCRRAGIRFFMVTGDFGLTGAAIARRVGIFSGEGEPDTLENILKHNMTGDETLAKSSGNHALLLEGTQLGELTDADWDVVCNYEEIVFGRTTPEQKLRIVTELKQRHNVVAVTGDGVNDAPALRASDVGIAIVSGSDVALEASDLVLMDKFSSIVDGIRLGRLVFQNLQKVIGYLLPAGSWSEIWPVLLNVFLGVPLPLSSFLMIIICVFTDLFCALSLVMEREEFDLLSLPPRDTRHDHLITAKIYIQSYLFIGVMETVSAHAMFFLYMWRHAKIPASALFFAYEKYTDGFYGYTQDELTYFNTVGQCVYFITVVIMQWGNILSIRNKRLSILQADPIRKARRNPWLAGSILISFCIAVFVTEVPGIQNLFVTASVPIEFWILPIPLALGVLVMDEMRKLAVRTWPKGPIARIAW
jgi:sodium/potassium-transporting ATPase subunit alpha